eukprot:Sdes_comp15945_c0_seq1m5093
MPSVDSKPFLDTHQSRFLIKEIETDVVVTKFQDSTFILVTQFDSMGTVFKFCNVPQEEPQEEQQETHPDYTLSVLTGKRDDLILEVFARNIGMSVDIHEKGKPVIISLGIKSELLSSSQRYLQEIINSVLKTGNWI